MTCGPLRVAAVQAESVSGDVAANVAAAVAAHDEAARGGAHVVFLPERFLTDAQRRHPMLRDLPAEVR